MYVDCVFLKPKAATYIALLATFGDIVLNIIDRSKVIAFDCCVAEY